MIIAIGLAAIIAAAGCFLVASIAAREDELLAFLGACFVGMFLVVIGINTITTAGHGIAVDIDDSHGGSDFLSKGTYYDVVLPSAKEGGGYYSVIHKEGETDRLVVWTGAPLPECFIFTPGSGTRYSPCAVSKN